MKKLSYILKVSLLSSTMLIATPAYAGGDDGDTGIEDRVKHLEALMEKILARMEKQDARLQAGEIKVLQETKRMIGEQKTALAVQAKRVAKVEKMSAGGVAPPTSGNGFNIGETTFKFGGYAKLDVLYSKFSDGELASGASGRDFLIPGQIPVSATGNDDGADIDFSARETRFIMKTSTPTPGGKITGHLEMDFVLTGGGNERVSNSFSPRLRQAFLTYNGWTFGQAWSTFQNTKVWLDHIDFLGAISGMVFNRQALARYQNGGFEFAVETPETTLTALGGSRVVSGDGALPDVVARYTSSGSWGHVRVAGIYRQLVAEAGTAGLVAGDTTAGYGVSVSGKLKTTGKDAFSFQFNAGEGLGRYIGLNLVNDAAVTTSGELEAIGLVAGFASYKHYWSPQWRSNVTVGFFNANNPTTFTGTGVTDKSTSIHANLLYSPAPKLLIGVEYIYADRTTANGLKGTLSRVQFSAKLGF
ncbi:MAG: hypothetical protein JKY60_09935 [Kordiimonadaceae bacterium]|nr:hypothetical protein [Kordiimonadaceae bacterium]